MKAYIDDGCTERGYVAAVPGLHEAVRFSYRPATTPEQNRLQIGCQKLDAEKALSLRFGFLVQRLVEWDLVDRKSQPAPRTTATLERHVKPALFWRLYNIVAGFEASDQDPEATPEAKGTDTDMELRAIMEGLSPGAAREEADEKNSPTG
jgi:hypothetical protein